MAVYVTAGDPNPYSMSEVILTIYNVVVKGYHECSFSVELGECIIAQKKRGDRGNVLKVLKTHVFLVIDWSSISDINRLIVID